VIRYCLTLVVLFGCVASARADKTAAVYATFLPNDANSVSVVHMDKILSSQRANQEDWTDKQNQLFSEGHIGLPPWLKTFVLASLVHPAVPEEVWATAIMDIPEDMTIQQIASKTNATMVTLADQPAFQTSTGAYVVELPDHKLAGYRPGHRQDAAAWIRSLGSGTNSLSPYLMKAAAADEHVVMSIELIDMFDVDFVKTHLEQDKRFASQQGLIPRLLPLLTSLQGVTLKISVTDQINSVVTIDFGDEVGPSAAIVKTLFITALDDTGASIEEFSKATITPAGNSVTLTCSLSDQSLQRILSLIVPPRVPEQKLFASSEAPEQTTEESAANQKEDEKNATQRYVRAVSGMVDDLQRASMNLDNYRKTIAWHETYARKIEQLSTRNVPKEVVDMGLDIAAKFRTLTRSLRGEQIQIGAENKSVVYDYKVNPGYINANIWGGVGYGQPTVNWTSNLQEVRERQAAAVIAGQSSRDKIWAEINDSLTKMKKIAIL
tara:strand:- start:8559 stop:10037 length:1479 start_codon:yes stop_codon:yes gene_type:complete